MPSTAFPALAVVRPELAPSRHEVLRRDNNRQHRRWLVRRGPLLGSTRRKPVSAVRDVGEPGLQPPASGELGDESGEEAFAAWLGSELAASRAARAYPELMSMSEAGVGGAILRWRRRFRGDATTWKRLWKADRVLKEVDEVAPVLDRALRWVAERPPGSPRVTLLDLCSGKGYLGMLLAELCPPDSVERIVLVDQAWPLSGAPDVGPHHINWDHIYGRYFHSWPVTLVTSKQNIKKRRTLAAMADVLLARAEGPVALLAVHLCGTLSLRAVDLFNTNPADIGLLVLKPCCLPRPQPRQLFTIGLHTFPGAEVRGVGRFVPHSEAASRWRGPPRWQLAPRFNRWADHLVAGIEPGQGGRKGMLRLQTAASGGYQDAYLVAERPRLFGLSAEDAPTLCEATPVEATALTPQATEDSKPQDS
eukprot:jgi/Tetstr1/455902/TSEL_042683.t1